jgi:hypothetical protein
LPGAGWGRLIVRYIFMDEAGTSATEPVTVVVGIIANADKHVMLAESLMEETLGAVPPPLQKGFVFHATDVFQNRKYQSNGWSLTDRLSLLSDIMTIPRRTGMSIALATHWRGSVEFDDEVDLGLSQAQYEHLHTFSQCVAIADRNVRRNAGATEVATIVAEDVPQMRKLLRIVPIVLRRHGFSLPQHLMRVTPDDEEAGYINQSGDMRVTRIRRAVHFVEKADDPLVQLADACAFGFRRYFAQEKFGTEFVRAILGDERALRNFASPGGAECYWAKNDEPIA